MFISIPPAWCGGTLTLSQAIQEALASSPTLKRLDAAVEGESWKRRGSTAGFLPHVTAEGTHFLDAKYAYLPINFGGESLNMPSAFPGTDLAVNVQMDLFDGFRTLKNVQAGQLNVKAARLEREDGAFKLERQVRHLFYGALAAQALLKVLQSRITSLEELSQITAAREAGGAGTHYDSLRVKTQLEEAQAAKTVADDDIFLARKNLARTMGLDSDDRDLEGALPVPNSKNLSSLPRPVTADRSDLKALDLRAKSLSKQAGAALTGYWPRVSVFGQKSFYNYGSFDPMVLTYSGYQSAYSVGLNLSWDLFDGGADLAKSKAIHAAAEQTRQTLREAHLQASDDIETWARRYMDYTLLYQANLRNIERAEESLRLSKLGLREGTQINLEVLEAESDLYNARVNSIQSQVNAADAWMKLEVALGKALP